MTDPARIILDSAVLAGKQLFAAPVFPWISLSASRPTVGPRRIFCVTIQDYARTTLRSVLAYARDVL